MPANSDASPGVTSKNKIGSPVDQFLLFCYHYDPATGKYSAVVMNIVRLAGLVTLLVLAALLVVLWRRDLRRSREVQPGGVARVH